MIPASEPESTIVIDLTTSRRARPPGRFLSQTGIEVPRTRPSKERKRAEKSRNPSSSKLLSKSSNSKDSTPKLGRLPTTLVSDVNEAPSTNAGEEHTHDGPEDRHDIWNDEMDDEVPTELDMMVVAMQANHRHRLARLQGLLWEGDRRERALQKMVDEMMQSRGNILERYEAGSIEYDEGEDSDATVHAVHSLLCRCPLHNFQDDTCSQIPGPYTKDGELSYCYENVHFSAELCTAMDSDDFEFMSYVPSNTPQYAQTATGEDSETKYGNLQTLGINVFQRNLKPSHHTFNSVHSTPLSASTEDFDFDSDISELDLTAVPETTSTTPTHMSSHTHTTTTLPFCPALSESSGLFDEGEFTLHLEKLRISSASVDLDGEGGVSLINCAGGGEDRSGNSICGGRVSTGDEVGEDE